MRVTFPNGVVVQASGLGRPEDDSEPQFGLYLDRAWRPSWPHEILGWPDFGVPTDAAAADDAIVRAWSRASGGELVEVGCLGGLGRTGTVLACWAVLAGISADDAVTWVRENYNVRAVETAEQEAFVRRFARER